MGMMWIFVWTNRETAIQGYSRSSVVVPIYDFLLALKSNLTSIFNRSWDITPSLNIHVPSLFQLELAKAGRGVGYKLELG